ncbi:MAG TPA: sulfotransferase [Verrucomicrobiae bacterium]|nr:sulfotransferase [Verrucomicrobiae bacterium]
MKTIHFAFANQTNARWSQCACVLGGICLATLIRFPFRTIIHDASPFMFYFPIVVVVAILFGWRQGLLATALSVLPANYYWMPPDNAFEMNLSDAWHILGFSFVGLSVSWLSGNARKHKQLEEYMRATLASVGDAIVTTDSRGSIVYLNTNARMLTELHGDEGIGRTLGSTLDLLTENGEHSLNATFQKSFLSDDIETLPQRVTISSKSGKRYRLAQKTSRILDAGGRKLGLAILFHRLECDDAELPATGVVRKDDPLHTASMKLPAHSRTDASAIRGGRVPADWIEAREFNKRGLFIGGAPKSGTTLLISLLDSHPQLVTMPEETCYLEDRPKYLGLKDYQSKLRVLLGRLGALEPGAACLGDIRHYANFDHDRFIALAEDFVSRPGMNDSLFLSEVIRAYGIVAGYDWQNCVCWVEKTPRTETYAGFFDELFPDARLIQIVRDPRAVFASRKGRVVKENGDYTEAHRLTRSWNSSALEIPRMRRDPSRFLVVRYEDLVKNPRAVLETICGFGGFDFDSRMLEPTRGGVNWRGNSNFDQAFNGISAAPAERWKTCLAEDEIWWIELHCRNGMELNGYQLRTHARFSLLRWLKRLPDESLKGYLRARRDSLRQGLGLLKECRFDDK